MPVLKNARHEAFAQGLAKAISKDRAYIEAGFRPNRAGASRLAAKANILQRVSEIRTRLEIKAEWSAAERLMSLKAIHDAAADKDARTAIAAIAEANKMQGSHSPVKNEVTGRNGGPIATMDVTRLKGMTDQELDILERAMVQIGIAEGDTGGEE